MQNVLGDRKAIAILLGPALLIYSVVMLIPVFWSLGYTLFEGNAIVGFEFVGLDNFVRLIGDSEVHAALLFTLKYAAVVTIGQVLLGYLLSLLYVFALKRASGLVRTLVFFPVVMPTVAVALLFQQLFSIAPTEGVVNSMLSGLGGVPVDWFGDGASAFIVIAIMDIWRSMGFYGVLLYAGLIDIPEDVLESARLDGASGWKLVRHVVLPLSAPVLISSLIFSINGTLKVFDSVLALTNGGPGTSTSPLTISMFDNAFTYGNYGYGSTIAMLLTIICLVVTVFIFRANARTAKKGGVA
ncbi:MULTISPECIES: carbohydrate ABC transporter permease [unclassified Microbacterium]|jgi:multiple sugar transport system permease protein/raffinose/stachyose/melibiose transport system permease protein|uniref:carbohydrate ABC transporter permease n=1 Tax=unclassified Microbacterium TaxID=2609290 RepID=UPI000D00243F|nr:sugar ABC transporter permease [Microbacterium sp. MYb45]PRB64069.1 ABC transporter permease [Microbacterium sp. MYb45]